MTPLASSGPCLFLILLNHSRLEIVYFKLPLLATQRYSVRESDLKSRQKDEKAVKAQSHEKDRQETEWGLSVYSYQEDSIRRHNISLMGNVSFFCV